MNKPVIGISSCLTGNHVRYDAGDKMHRSLLAWLRNDVELIAICPEVAIGMGIPRPPIELSDDVIHPEARQVDQPDKIYTMPLKKFGWQVAEEYVLDGYIFKSRSPSCGLGSTTVKINGLIQQRTVSGIYASSLVTCLPYLPVTEAEALTTGKDCYHFINKCLEYRNSRLAMETVLNISQPQ